MSSKDYTVTMPDGSQVIMEVENKAIPITNIDKLSGQELEAACVKLFTNLGWTVKQEQIITMETGTIRPDLVLSDGKKDYGYVEVVTSMDGKTILKKKKSIQLIMDKCKPELFVLTNGMVFDIFYNGKFAGSQTTPPSIDSIKQKERLMAYYNAIMKIKKDDNDGK